MMFPSAAFLRAALKYSGVEMNGFVTFSKQDFYEFMGEMALPPWQDADGEWIGTEIPCAPIAQKIIEWTKEHNLNPTLIMTEKEGPIDVSTHDR